jgi:hypothetical protein
MVLIGEQAGRLPCIAGIVWFCGRPSSSRDSRLPWPSSGGSTEQSLPPLVGAVRRGLDDGLDPRELRRSAR